MLTAVKRARLAYIIVSYRFIIRYASLNQLTLFSSIYYARMQHHNHVAAAAAAAATINS